MATVATRRINDAARSAAKAKQAPAVENPVAVAALRCLQLREQAKALYAAADEAEAVVMASVQPGTVVTLADGRRVTVTDNFAAKNVAFRPCAVRRFEIVTTK